MVRVGKNDKLQFKKDLRSTFCYILSNLTYYIQNSLGAMCPIIGDISVEQLICIKGEVGNTILNTKGKTSYPPTSVCNKHIGVT